jgi:hypothetical protein
LLGWEMNWKRKNHARSVKNGLAEMALGTFIWVG